MPEELIHCLWLVYETGYEWIETTVWPPPESPPLSTEEETRDELRERKRLEHSSKPIPYLTNGISPGQRFSAIRYKPLELYPGLFRIFAETELSQEGIRTFASKYGYLGGKVTETIALPGRRIGNGESLGNWINEILEFREALQIWELAQAGDAQGLSEFIEWEGNDKILFDTLPEVPDEGPYTKKKGLLANKDNNPEILELSIQGDVIMPALYLVQRFVNKHVEGETSPKLLWTTHHSRLALCFFPTSLIGALWLQFAQAISGEKSYRRCRECGTWFELHPDIARTSKRYCSNACRSKAYRKRASDRDSESRKRAKRRDSGQ